jgi:Zn-dependent peptidase ImmA (M78 family)
MTADHQKAKKEALELLKKFGIAEPPINPVDIAHNLGVKVLFVEFSDEYNDIAGFYDFDDDTIFVNKEEFPLRQTFTIAHELGHRVLHKEWAKSADYKVLMRQGTSDEPVEKEANTFAANLLVPRFLLDKYWEDLPASRLSELFAVSVPVINHRISFEYGA